MKGRAVIKKLLTLSNIIFAVTMLYGGAVIAKVYYDQSQLPPGVCPIDNNNELIYSAIAVLIIGIVASFFIEKRDKKIQSEKEND